MPRHVFAERGTTPAKSAIGRPAPTRPGHSLLVLLGEADGRNLLYAHLHHVHYRRELPLAAIDDDQVRKRGKRFVLAVSPGVARQGRRLASSMPGRVRARRKRRRSTSAIDAKSFAPSTVLIRNRRYSCGRGWPSTNTTIDPTDDVLDVRDVHRSASAPAEAVQGLGKLVQRPRRSSPRAT